jgi:hypothetical protein
MTGAELKAAGMVSVERGWIILCNGRRVEDRLYPTERAARASARCFPNAAIAPAKRVWTIHRRKPDWTIGEAE